MLGLGLRLRSSRSFGPPVPRIALSSNSVSEDASTGDAVGTLSVRNGSGTYTFALVDDAGDRFALDGAVLELGATALDYDAASVHAITVEADNGVDAVITRTLA